MNGLKGFVAAIIGGLGSYPLTAVAALVVGIVEAFSSFYASNYKEVIVFMLLIPVLLLICGVIGTIYSGVASPTDAAAIGVVLSLILAMLSGGFGMAQFKEALLSATRTSAMIAFILIWIFFQFFLGGGSP